MTGKKYMVYFLRSVIWQSHHPPIHENRIVGSFGRNESTLSFRPSLPPIAQLVEHPTLNRQVVGSIPTGRTRRNKRRFRVVFSYRPETERSYASARNRESGSRIKFVCPDEFYS